MVAQASLDNLRPSGYTFKASDGDRGRRNKTNSVSKMREMQDVLHKVVTGAVRWYNGEEVVDIDPRVIATNAVAFTKLEERCRLNLGKANPAPIKSEGKAKSRSRSGLVPPAPRVAEPEPIAKPTEPIPTATDPLPGVTPESPAA